MRVIAGQYRGRTLKSPPDLKVRPTSDRLRETLFNVIAPRIVDSRFLDLCAGTGAIGIEAVSRGAEFVTFVDKSRKSCGLIEANLDALGVPESQTNVVMSDAEDFLRRITRADDETREGWDIVFFDPPYLSEYIRIIGTFSPAESNLLSEDGIIIAEHHHKTELPDAVEDLRRWRIIKQGDSCLSFYER
ncbi:MAG: 16S rRNA (guanine(966)-N(2))-methyltransferase RsmD [Pyrinomonadaceae bacterium]|nr:16S rRNA (guanine(966)-N(2))-methyltransferase RsmD [Pyrinomonadaceae bacterium]